MMEEEITNNFKHTKTALEGIHKLLIDYDERITELEKQKIPKKCWNCLFKGFNEKCLHKTCVIKKIIDEN